MKVEELMTRGVVTATAGTSLKEVARLLVERGVSGLPVVDDAGRVVGVVSEGDIVARERGAGRERFDLLAWLTERDAHAVARKLDAHTAGEAMSAPPITIAKGEPAAKAAAYVIDRGVNRLPVVDDDGSLVGIVSRADLVRAFARDDAELAREIREEVLLRALSIPSGTVEVEVEDGEVTLSGRVETEGLAELAASLTRRVLGVVGVVSRLVWEREEPRWPEPVFPGRAAPRA
jgi:CBS domain-containing protein